jgi:arsenate reductase (thioredoxin)
MTFKNSVDASATFYPELKQYLKEAVTRFDKIPNDRRGELAQVADYIRDRLSNAMPAKLIFICTHNSRRSHLSQIWAQVGSGFYGLQGVETYSGGTEATAMNPRVVAALQRCGLKIHSDNPLAANPVYEVANSDSSIPQLCFSKVYSDPSNPSSSYCAVMTCSQADDACPLVKGCDLRIAIRYEDPKVADDTENEAQRYDERSAQICTEMLYVMSLL